MTIKDFMSYYNHLQFDNFGSYRDAIIKNDKKYDRADRFVDFVHYAPYIYFFISFIAALFGLGLDRIQPVTDEDRKLSFIIGIILVSVIFGFVVLALIHAIVFSCPIWRDIDPPKWLQYEDEHDIRDRYQKEFCEQIRSELSKNFDIDEIEQTAKTIYQIEDFNNDFYNKKDRVREVLSILEEENNEYVRTYSS